jgi:hypothetical protein
MGKQSVELLAQTEILSKGQNKSHPGGAGDLRLVKGAEFEISEALGYHQIAFLESHLQGEISGFLERLYFIQIAGKIEAFFCPNNNIPPLAEYQGHSQIFD